MIYLNHAATTYPKPDCVLHAVERCMEKMPQSQYRAAMEMAEEEDTEKLCQNNLARLFGIRTPGRIFFTSGSTQALNMAILGFRSKRKKIVFTATEHNSVLRTIFDGLKESINSGDCIPVMVPCDDSGFVDMERMEREITEDTALVIVNHSSNVTGAVQDVTKIGDWAHQKGACFLMDASQSAGTVRVDAEAMKIDMLAFTGHKSLFGIQGSGGLYIREGTDVRPILFGGTGTDSRILVPETPFYQVGTANEPGIAGLNAGVEWILKEGTDKIMAYNNMLITKLYEGLKECKGVRVIGEKAPSGTVVSFVPDKISPQDMGYILAGSYGIVVRTGLHCAPLIHSFLGTEKNGTVRASISYLTKEEDVDALLMAVREITQ